MKNKIWPPGIQRKKLYKTRIIKRFIWFKKLQEWKFLETAYILQVCRRRVGYTGFTSIDPEQYLEWTDFKWASKQSLFIKCSGCGNELTASGSFISDDEEWGVKYKCTDCGKESFWNFDLFPCPIETTDGKYPSPREMKVANESK